MIDRFVFVVSELVRGQRLIQVLVGVRHWKHGRGEVEGVADGSIKGVTASESGQQDEYTSTVDENAEIRHKGYGNKISRGTASQKCRWY